MKSTIVRIGLALAALWLGGQAAEEWLPGGWSLVRPGFAQVLGPATLPAATVAPQAPQLRAASGASSAAQGFRLPSQMFGNSARPGTNANANGATPGAEGSMLRGTERFLRRNRRADSFVGTDAKDGHDFVGATSSGDKEQVDPTTGIPRLSAGNAGVDGSFRPGRSYPPRLSLGFERPQTSGAAISATLTRLLQKTPGLHPENQIAVSVAGSTATLQGVVASARDRALVEKLVLFEPGISAVRNDLRVSPPPPDPEPPLPDASESPRPNEPPADSATRP